MTCRLVVALLLGLGLGAQADVPTVFAPGVISVPDTHDDYISLSPDGRMAVFTRLEAGYRGGTLYLADASGSGWSNVRVAPFSGTYQDSRASFSPDGQRIFFASNRPGPGRETRADLDIWRVDRQPGGWSDPVNVGAPVNTTAHETHPSVAHAGALYFVRRTQDSDIWMAPAAGAGGFGDPVRLPDGINSPRPDSHVFVDPAERFLLFAREVAGSGDDLFVAVRRNGQWSSADPLGPEVNTPQYDYSGKVFVDRLFFTRNGQWSGGGPADIMSIPIARVPALAAFAR